jgi:O-acetylhomoserine/O-acetylserine sulfhydrylase-like pyridoxal-dependent enzyme
MLQGKLEEAVRQFKALSPVERMSMIALQAIGYVASETFMGVIEDAGDFDKKRARALGALRWMERALHGNTDAICTQTAFLQKLWLLTPRDLEKAKENVSLIIQELETLDRREERATRFL